jgi:glutamine synthetase
MSHDFSLPEGTHTVVMGLGDANGIMRGKRFPASHWPSIVKSGNALSASTFAMDMTCDVWDTPYVNFGNGFPDIHMFPMGKPFSLPWEPGVAMCFGRAEDMEHKPVPIDPRNALLRQLARADAMGYEVQVGCELEFYLLDPQTMLPRDEGIDCYGLDRAAELEHVLGPIRQQINACGIPIEQSNPEYSAGQVEVNIRYDEALKSADNVVLFRSLVRQLARAHGYRATFMPKPFIDGSGNGFHTHYSLWKDGQNVFSNGGHLNDLGRHFVGGLQKRIAEASICGCPTPNGYKRRQPMSFCPTNASWGIDNRTVALRVIEGSQSAVRVEKRDAGADANPYYLLAADISAGLDGIEQGLEPGKIITGNAYEAKDIPPLPRDAQTALYLARQSEWLQDVMGRDGFEIYVQQAEREIEFISNQVTPVEQARYLKSF